MGGLGRPTARIVLRDDERETLERWARRRNSSQVLALRCRIVLGAADGRLNKDIAAELAVMRPRLASGGSGSLSSVWRVCMTNRGRASAAPSETTTVSG